MDLEKLDKVATLARSEESRAAGVMQQNRQTLEQSNARLAQLNSFKGEYEERLSSLASKGIDARRLADYRSFLSKLDEAISMLEQEIGRHESELRSSRDAYVQRSTRRSSVDELIQRGRLALAQAEGRREQRANDEANLQRHDNG